MRIDRAPRGHSATVTGDEGRAPERLRRGDRVSWRSHGSVAVGTVVREITERTEAAGRTVNASPNAPRYEVVSEASGGTAVHRPEALTRLDDRS
ncbi:DUF2945 domain-containing protein [Streptomyces radicis]|uniref:DUF2945 domain-containing protein n=1 Tax=Streptomyces radicis TaxID=1750517 RepID=A0A3A9W2S9_9ACTN|nr:DUF2945 domain-containing protein [Streptomyces radicis]RKN07210.1 DUF2945 domain-containing protein [Streptomyces radicis]RKN26772.1 DUF2945 domain-containing protein [Streptomyces radicis]